MLQFRYLPILYSGRNAAVVDDLKDFGFSIFCDCRLEKGFTEVMCFEEEARASKCSSISVFSFVANS